MYEINIGIVYGHMYSHLSLCDLGGRLQHPPRPWLGGCGGKEKTEVKTHKQKKKKRLQLANSIQF